LGKYKSFQRVKYRMNMPKCTLDTINNDIYITHIKGKCLFLLEII
jgi:hypothetical protein